MENGRIYSFGNFQLDPANRQLLRDDKPVTLSAKAFDLLHTLLENNGRLVGKDELFNSVWRDQIVEESNLTVHVSQIRKALGENKNNPRYIETVPGYGYRFVGKVSNTEEEFVIETQTLSRITIENETADVETVGPADAEIVEREKIAALPASPRLPISKSQKMAAGAVAVVLLVGGIFWVSNRYQNNAPNGSNGRLQIKRLTTKGTVANAVLSPDGKFFVYTLRERDARRDGLWLGQTSGGGDVQLRPTADLAYNPRAFSADGQWVYYVESEPRKLTGTLYKMPVLGGVSQQILGNISTYAVLSQNEKQVAFVREEGRGADSALVISNLDGTEERELAVRQADQSFSLLSLAWSPDGGFIAFAAGMGGGDGQEIFAANTANGEIRQLTSLDLISVHSLTWQTDGRGLVGIVSDRNSLAATQIWRIDAESGKGERITNDLQTYGTSVSLSADSTVLLAVQSTKESSLWVAPVDNLAAARQITFASAGLDGWYGADWTPEGKIIYASRIEQSLTLWKTDADGENAKQIGSVGFLDHRPTATPDGKYIVFQSNRSGSYEIWRMNSDGTNLVQLTSDGGQNVMPHVTPDESAVIYTRYSHDLYSIWRVSIDGGQAMQITGTGFFYARISPDGNFFACGYGENGKTKLAIMPIAGGAPVKSFDAPPTFDLFDCIRWSRDGNFIYYRDWANGIWQQNVAGGEPKRLEGLPAEKLYAFNWSPDGKQLAFTRGREVRDAVLIGNFK